MHSCPVPDIPYRKWGDGILRDVQVQSEMLETMEYPLPDGFHENKTPLLMMVQAPSPMESSAIAVVKIFGFARLTIHTEGTIERTAPMVR